MGIPNSENSFSVMPSNHLHGKCFQEIIFTAALCYWFCQLCLHPKTFRFLLGTHCHVTQTPPTVTSHWQEFWKSPTVKEKSNNTHCGLFNIWQMAYNVSQIKCLCLGIWICEEWLYNNTPATLCSVCMYLCWLGKCIES